ncbi:heat shock transcription factor, X-linked-like [Ursus maritimus]|uniref:Heat shock transcription factor, X-linked-like n=1 Tax=Ursus maritimus TaxID=29073 RepID=A0A8M1GB10_URSMA|nr:heat shock transcription factor, X-linked-like [Ursus maritimus]
MKGHCQPRSTVRSPEGRMASEEESGPPPFPPEALAPASAASSQHSAPPPDPPLSLAQPVSARDPGCRLLLLEENGFQALTQEPLFKRPRTTRDAPSPGEGDLLHLPFPKKLWKLVNSSQFASIWWDNDGTCIGINEKLFQEEVLEREGPNKVFETDCMKSFVRQLNLYGFSKLQQDIHTFTCLTNSLPGGAPLCVPSKLRFYRSPFFKRDCPHLLLRMKRRVGVKSALRQMESKPEALGIAPAAPTASLRPEGVLSSAGDQLEPVSGRQPDVPAAWVRSQSAPPVILGAAARPTVTDAHAAVGRPADGQPQGAQAPVPLAADVAGPAAFPWVCLTLPSVHMHPYGPVLGLAAGPPVFLHVPATPLPVAGLLPLCHPWVPGVPPGPATSLTVIPHPPNPFHCCPGCRCFPTYLPPTDGPPEYPGWAHHSS